MSFWAAGALVVGTVGGAVVTSKAAKKGAKDQAEAADEATAEDRRQYDLAREDLAPFREAGYTALGQLGEGTKEGGDFNRDFTLADFNKDPGYQFRMDEGQKALERSASARGGVLSGAALKDISRYGQDYASGEYSSAYSRFNKDRDTRFNRLAALAGVGQTATDRGIAAGERMADSVSENVIGAANARAAGRIGQANAINSGIQTLGNFYLQNKFGYKPANPATGGP